MRAHGVLQAESRFETCFIVRIDDARHAFTNQGTGHRIQLYFIGIRNLLNANYDIQRFSLLLAFIDYLITFEEITMRCTSLVPS